MWENHGRRPGPRSPTIPRPSPHAPDARVIDIVIPVYRGLAQTRACIESVLQSDNRTPCELVVVDDASPEAQIPAMLDSLAAEGRITLLRNPDNRGFVHSVNRGMAAHPERDVVLLNSDTEVANDWLDRLVACARNERVATVTPFSNNATICSFPNFCQDNPLPAGWDVATLDATFRETNAGAWVELPTAVGFCMLIRREALVATGAFDEAAFRRGYGEEADFCRRASALGWRHLLCADTFVFHAGGVSFGDEQAVLSDAAQEVLRARHPDYSQVVAQHLRLDPARNLRRAVELSLHAEARVEREQAGEAAGRVQRADADSEFVQLHVVHALGGGIERWLADYCAADTARRNLVLRPVGRDRETVVGLALFEGPGQDEALAIWPLAEPYVGSVADDADYRAVLHAVLADYQVGAVLVSSLIGHSVDALRSGLPTLLIQHDYHPFCPAINLHFRGGCPDCTHERLARCAQENHDFNLFPGQSAAMRAAVRDAARAALDDYPVQLVQPSHGVAQRVHRIRPDLPPARFATLPHGQDRVLSPLPPPGPEQAFRVVVLGMLSVSKGVRLLERLLPQLPAGIELHLLGAGDLGRVFADDARVRVTPRYEAATLPTLLRQIQPRLGLLLSIWPETYSYTLTELQCAGVPTLATGIGAFAERIRDGETGFLAPPTAEAIAARLAQLVAEPATVETVRRHLGGLPRRSAAEMVADYHRLLPVRRRWRVVPELATADRPAPLDGSSSAARCLLDLQRTWQRGQASQDAHAATARMLKRSQAARKALRAERDGARADRQATAQIAEALGAELDALHRSTSWRVTAPLRWLGRQVHRARRVAEWASELAADSPRRAHAVATARRGWRAGGLRGLRLELSLMAAPPPPAPLPDPPVDGARPIDKAFTSWARSRDALHDTWQGQLAALPRRPRISVLVPVFNPPEAMLAGLVDSVRGQVYPDWELCLADDASTQPHVHHLLARFAGMDPRIRVSFGDTNRGVSAASNRALSLASGEFAVLADHDDLLEPHALLRFAQSVCEDAPDLVYSDEALTGPDGARVQHFAFRPAFSPEYLRAHPYIVHLVGFRTALLRELGGWDEALRISQDVDLILRASERARCVVHIPDLLYRWRVHGGSAGHVRMGEVMATSRRVLERHLARSGEAGTVSDGRCFNFFETRYPPPPGARVAIIVPTHNQAGLVAACLAGIEATCVGVNYRVLLVDHASDEPEALAYFDSLGDRVDRQRQAGDFNFARINNQAVAALPDDFSHLLFLNNDVQPIEPGWLAAMLELAARPDVGAVGARLDYPDGHTVQHAGVVVAACGLAENLGRFRDTRGDGELDQGYMGSLIATRELSAVTAACLLMRREVFEAVDGFDESLAVGYGDVDLCLRVREAGYRVLYCARARLLHHESMSRGRQLAGDPHPEDSARFRQRWASCFDTGDPYFSPNLSPHSPNWQIRQPLVAPAAPRRRICERDTDGHYRLRFSGGG